MPSASVGRIGRTWATVPSRRTTSASHSRGVPRWAAARPPWAHRATPPPRGATGGHTGPVELREAVRRRRMVRRFDPDGPVPRRGRAATSSAPGRARPERRASARAGTSSPCSTPARPGGVLGGHRRRHAPGRLAPRGLGRPGPRALPVRPGRLPRPLRRARQGLDRPVHRPLAGARTGTPTPAWRRWSCCSAPRTPASARCSSGCPASGTTRCARRSASPTDRRLVGVVALGHEAERVGGLAAHPAPPRRSTRCSTWAGSACR